MLVGYYSANDANHERAAEIVREIWRGQHGHALVSDLIVAETLNFMVVKSRDPKRPEAVARDLLGEGPEPWLELVRIDAPTWWQARDRFRALSQAGMSFTDCTSIAFLQRDTARAIASFDAGFDAFVPRLC